MRRFSPFQLLSMERDAAAEYLVAQAVSDGDPERRRVERAHIARLIRLAAPRSDIVRAEIYRVSWAVNPLALPPLDWGRPARRELLGVIEMGAP